MDSKVTNEFGICNPEEKPLTAAKKDFIERVSFIL